MAKSYKKIISELSQLGITLDTQQLRQLKLSLSKRGREKPSHCRCDCPPCPYHQPSHFREVMAERKSALASQNFETVYDPVRRPSQPISSYIIPAGHVGKLVGVRLWRKKVREVEEELEL
jgi:hypothetical protein